MEILKTTIERKKLKTIGHITPLMSQYSSNGQIGDTDPLL